MLFNMNRSWSLHVVVLPMTSKKCIKIKNTRTEQLFCSLNFFLVTILLALPSWFAKALKKISELKWKETEERKL